MKRLILTATAFLFAGCAYTRISDPTTGKPILFTQMDGSNVTLTAPGITFHADSMNHSTPTLAGGTAFSQGANAVSGGVATDLLAAGASNIFAKGTGAVSSKSLVVPAAAVGVHMASKPKVPATPAPTAAQIWPEKS